MDITSWAARERGREGEEQDNAGAERKEGGEGPVRDDAVDFHKQVAARRAMLDRQDSKGNIRVPEPHLQRGMSQCSEFFREPESTLVEDLRRKFDPSGQGSERKPGLYSDQALMQRESLKFDPLVVRTMEELWAVIDVNENGVMDHDEYREFHSKLSLVLVPTASIGECRALCDSDWERDTAGGTKEINKGVFGESMFELADRWTNDISAPDYINFLQGTFQAVSEVDPKGRRVYKSDKTLKSNMHTLSPFSKLHASTLAEARAKVAAFERAKARAYRDGTEVDWDEIERLFEQGKLAKEEDVDMSKLKLKAKSKTGKNKAGSRRPRRRRRSVHSNGLSRSGTGLSDKHLFDGQRARRHTLNGALPGSATEASSEESSGASSESKTATSESERAARARWMSKSQAPRCYPPPAEWWAKNARSQSRSDAARSRAAAEAAEAAAEELAQQDRVGVLLFDPSDPAHIHQLIVSTRNTNVVAHTRLEIRKALLQSTPPDCADVSADVVFVDSRSSAATCPNGAGPNGAGAGADDSSAQEPTFRHGISKVDWVSFCNAVDDVPASSSRWSQDYAFVGCTSAYNPSARRLCCNVQFSSAEMAAKLNNIAKRPALGLACPLLQAKVARFVTFKLLVECGNGAPASALHLGKKAASPHVSLLRSHSSQRLLHVLDGAKSSAETFMASLNKSGHTTSSPLFDKVEALLHEAQRDARDAADDFDGDPATLERHTLGALDDAERSLKTALLARRSRHRLAHLQDAYERRKTQPSLESLLRNQQGGTAAASLSANCDTNVKQKKKKAKNSKQQKQRRPSLPDVPTPIKLVRNYSVIF